MADNYSQLIQQLDQKREKYKAQLRLSLQEEEDPLALYEQFVKWTVDSYPDVLVSRSGLLELLEEATRQFIDDLAYKGDLRYLKLWSLYASHVEDPNVIYAFLISNNIGTMYAQVYEEYAAALERNGRRPDAENVYLQGIKRRARPVERLKKRYSEFQSRSSNPQAAARRSAGFWQDASPEVQALRRHPLKNHPKAKTGSRDSAPSSSKLVAPVQQPSMAPSTETGPLSSTKSRPKTAHDRYAPMLAPPAPGKRPEKLRFNLSLLFTEDRMEYSVQEARARSMGLLGKQWAPLPSSSSVHVNFNDDGQKDPKHTMRKAVAYSGGEPTVTLATKEALADVFGMYNSPEKSMRFGAITGSKYAPVRKIEPVTPLALHGAFRAISDENDGGKTPPFKPLQDENANINRKENSTTPAPSKFQIFRDEKAPTKPTPDVSRKVLTTKTPSSTTPASALSEKTPSLPRVFQADPSATMPKQTVEGEVFSSVFTAVASTVTSIPGRDTSANMSHEDVEPTVFHPPTTSAATKFVPYIDPEPQPHPQPVFSLPPSTSEKRSTGGQKSTFKPFVDEAPAPPKPVFSNPAPPLATPAVRTLAGENVPMQFHPEDAAEDDLYDSSESSYIDDSPAHEIVEIPIEDGAYVEDDSMFDDDVESYQVPLGGRLGQFNVMTPITERTFEYTTSTRASGTPSDGFGSRPFLREDALRSAEQLAAELHEDEEDYHDREEQGDEHVLQVEERTGSLSLSDVLVAASSFNPPNPCNPFDAPITSALLSFIPTDAAFHDLRSHESNQLDVLQNFAKKKGRRSNGSRRNSRDDDDTLQVQIFDRPYSIVRKLGEGGFGAVFEAIDVLALEHKHGEIDPDEFEEFEDEEEIPKVALKVVKPRSVWEFHVLRRIHQKLSDERLKRSIIVPEALYAYRDESFLVLELCKQGTLLEIVNKAGQAGLDRAGSCSLDELLVMFFAIELMRLLEGLHRGGFIHGDMKIDNCLLRLEDVDPPSAWTSIYQPSGDGGWGKKGIKLIDFGRTIDTQLFPVGQSFVGDWPTDARDCFELREGKPWTYQTDYFGLAGIIYCMLYGQYIDASAVVPTNPAPDGHKRYKLAAAFKRYWQVDLWTRLFDILLNPSLARPDGELPLCDELQRLRLEMEAWLQANCNRSSNTLKGLLKKVALYILGGKDGR